MNKLLTKKLINSHSKKCWVVLTQFWVMAGFVHILPKIGLKQPSIF